MDIPVPNRSFGGGYIYPFIELNPPPEFWYLRTMELTVETLTGTVVTLEVHADATVATLKTQLNQQIEGAEKTQSLFFNGVFPNLTR